MELPWDNELKDIDKIPMTTGPMDYRLHKSIICGGIIPESVIKNRVIKHRVRSGIMSPAPGRQVRSNVVNRYGHYSFKGFNKEIKY